MALSALRPPFGKLRIAFSALQTLFGKLRTAFSALRLPFGKLRTAFSALRLPFGKLQTAFSALRLPFGKLQTAFSALQPLFGKFRAAFSALRTLFEPHRGRPPHESAATGMRFPGKHLTAGALALVSAWTASAQVNITTWQADPQHTGANLNETHLTPALVGSPGNFGFLFSQPMDGQSYSQPLYVSGLDIGGTVHNVVYMTTEHDSVYAFDADGDVGPNATPLWKVSLLPPGATSVPQADTGSGDVRVELGITATPVIDLATQTLYTVAKFKLPGAAYEQWLHALDLKTGDEKPGSPVLVNPTFAGDGFDAAGGLIAFQPLREHGRAALALHDGVLYVTYASHGDSQPFHGEILGFDPATLALVKTFITTPNGDAAGIWMGGASPAFDNDGHMYVAIGNGSFDQNPSGHTTGTDWGESVLKLPTAGPFTVSFSNPLDWFTPNSWSLLNFGDLDLGSSGTLVLPDQAGPHPHLLLAGGKGGTLYVIDRDNMGGLATPNNSVQEITEPGGLFVTPAYYNGSIYYAPLNGKLTQRAVSYTPEDGTYLSPTGLKSNFTYSNGMGAGVFISANGDHDGIVWAIDRGFPARLHAYDAANVSGDPIYTGSATLAGGIFCNGIKFSLPTVANGKVYFATVDYNNVGHLMIFGQPVATVGTPAAPSALAATVNSSDSVTLNWTDNSTNELGFTVKRSTELNGIYDSLAPNANSNETSFTDTNLDPRTTYYYQVVAFNGNGNSTPSLVASATTFPRYAPDGLVACWSFDEGTGGTAKDRTGHGFDGALNGEVTWAGGINGNALGFHGTGAASSRVVVPDTAALRFGTHDSFTLSAWVYPSALHNAEQAVIAKSRDTGNYYGIWINAANQWVCRGPAGDITGPSAAENAWTHVAMVQDGSAGTRSFYVNGALLGSSAAQPANGTGDLWIGQANSGGDTVINSFPGSIDEVRLYNRALSGAEITSLLGPPILQAASVQTQGAAGDFARVLAPSNVKMIEPRAGSPAGQYRIVLNFSSPVSGIAASLALQNGGGATGSVESVTYAPSGKIATVSLTGVGNIQSLNLHLSGIQPGNGTADIPFNVLRGDTDQDNLVSTIDASLIHGHHTGAVDAATAFYDLNCDGTVNDADDAIADALLGTNLGPESETDLSAIATATASSFEQPDTQAPKAIDGIGNTRWSSLYSDPQWITVDLGRAFAIHSVSLDWEAAAGKTYAIQVSDDNASWTSVWNEPDNADTGLKTYDGANIIGRYVRVYGTQRLTPYGYSLWEFRVRGLVADTGAGFAPVITSPATATGIKGSPFSYQITASHGPTSFTASNLPAGLSLDSATGVISGSPQVAGAGIATISAINATGTDTKSLAITINAPAPDSDLAAGKTATTTSAQIANPAANASDNVASTRWSAASAAWPQSWTMDLGSTRTLSRLDIAWYAAPARAYRYRIETSFDGIAFTTAVDKTANSKFGNTSDAFAAAARYIRVTITGCSAAGALASAYEFRVFGH